MLTDNSLRDLLSTGYETSDADFVAHTQHHMSRTVYFMAQFLAQRKYKYVSSVELQRRIDDQFRMNGITPSQQIFNPVDWFSEQWTQAIKGSANQHFANEYREL